jgi:hypothetical protein
MVNCPQCGVRIEPTWDWCQGCGFDPEGLKPAGWIPSSAPQTPAATPWPPPSFTGPPATVPNPPGKGTRRRVGAVIGAAVVVLVAGVWARASLGAHDSATSKSVASSSTATTAPIPTIATTTTQPSWTTFTPADKAYTIDLPGTPHSEVVAAHDHLLPSKRYEFDGRDGTQYIVHSAETEGGYILDPTLTFAGEFLLYQKRGYAAAPAEDTTVAGLPAEKYIVGGGDGTQVEATCVVGRTRYFMIVIVTPKGVDADPVRYDHFLNSLQPH